MKKFEIPSQLSRWLPSRGNVIFVLLVASLLWTRVTGAFPSPTKPAADPPSSTSILAYQGRLADADDAPLTGNYEMIFRLYDARKPDASLLWQENWTGSNKVQVSDGLFSVMLGSLTPISQSIVTQSDTLWLGITVGADEEMTPRVQLGGMPFAVQANTVVDGSITTAKIGDKAVTSAKIANGTIATDDLANAAVTEAKIAEDAIDSAHIADGAVGSDQVAGNAIDSTHIANGAVATADLADSAVTGAKIAGDAIGSTHIADEAVGSDQIVGNAIGSIHIADGAVKSRHVAPTLGSVNAVGGEETLLTIEGNDNWHTIPDTSVELSVPVDSTVLLIATCDAEASGDSVALVICGVRVDGEYISGNIHSGSPTSGGGSRSRVSASRSFVFDLSAGNHTVDMGARIWQGRGNAKIWNHTGYTYLVVSQVP